VRQRRQPLRDRCGVIVDHVVDAAAAVLDRRDGRIRGVRDMDERPHAAAVADERELALAHQLELLLARCQRCARPVEGAVAQHDSLRPLRSEHRGLEMANRGQRVAHVARGCRVEWVVFVLHRPAGAHVRAEARDPLCHEPFDPDRLPGREQVVGRLGPQAVGRRSRALGVPRDPCQRGQLVHDHFRSRSRHGLGHLIGIECVRDDRHRAQVAEHRPLRLVARHAVNLMTRGDQARHQLRADRARRSCQKHFHDRLLRRRGVVAVRTIGTSR
jgi:hypothetical protein